MSPEHFMRTLTFWEAVLFVQGFHRRYHHEWEVARYSAFYSAAPHCKNFDFEKLGKFPWEKEDEAPVDKEQELREIAALRRRIAEREAMTEKERIDRLI
jgi:hypothetical protein